MQEIPEEAVEQEMAELSVPIPADLKILAKVTATKQRKSLKLFVAESLRLGIATDDAGKEDLAK